MIRMGIDMDRFTWIEHEREGAAEVALDRLESSLATGCFNMVVINSLKCLVPKVEHTKSLTEGVVAEQARMNSRMIKKVLSLTSEYETAFVIVTHLTTQNGGTMSRDPLVMTGGRAIAYASSLTMDFRKKMIQETDPIGREEGMKIGITVKKNRCVPSRNPFVKADYFIVYGEGTEQILSTLEGALKNGTLSQAGAFIRQFGADGEVDNWKGTKLQFQGKEKFRTFCRENPDYLASLKDKVTGIPTIVPVSAEELDEIQQEQLEISAGLSDEERAEIDALTVEVPKKTQRKKAS